MTKARNIADLGSNDVIETTATGVTVTGEVVSDGLSLGDNDKATFGASDDLEIYHDGGNSFIKDTGDGILFVQGSGGVRVLGSDTSESLARFNENGSVQLYHDNAEKLATTATGVDVTGTVTADGLTIYKSSADVTIANSSGTTGTTSSLLFSNGSTIEAKAGLIFEDKLSNNRGDLHIAVNGNTLGDPVSKEDAVMTLTSSGNVGIGTASPSSPSGFSRVAEISDSSSASFVASASGSDLELGVSSSGGWIGTSDTSTDKNVRFVTSGSERARIDSSGNLGIGRTSMDERVHIQDGNAAIRFKASNASGGYATFGLDSAATSDGRITWTNALIFGDSGSERARIDSSGTFMVNTTAPSFNPQVAIHTSKTYGLEIKASTGSTAPMFVRNANGVSGSRTQMFFMYDSTTIGSIGSTSTSTSYNTSSDERLKENIQDTTHSVNIDDIQVREFDWKVDGSHQRYGFIAQELETVYPEAVHSPEDPEEMKSVDYSKLVPLLVKEIQQLKAEIKELKA